MIGTKDLTIGNKVLYKGKIAEIATISINGSVGIFKGEFNSTIKPVSSEGIYPIPISRETLLNIGFVEDSRILQCEDEYSIYEDEISITISRCAETNNGKEYFCRINFDKIPTVSGFDINYLHEFQNGYRLATGKDFYIEDEDIVIP